MTMGDNRISMDLPLTADEYTRYAAVVWELVVDATTREDAVAMIAAYLTWVRCEMIGLGDREPRGGVEKEVAIAQRLLTLSDQLTNR